MKTKINLLAVFIVLSNTINAQFFDKYGASIGIAMSTQKWNYKIPTINNSDKDYKLGFSLFFNGEKNINELLTSRLGFGYLQKGFKDNVNWESIGVSGQNDKNVVLHNLGIDAALKITPLNQLNWKPYGLIGLRGDFIIAYKDIEIEQQGSATTFKPYSHILDDYHPFSVGAIIGLGAEFDGLYYAEFEFNPAMTPVYNGQDIKITDIYFSIKFGVHISELLKGSN